MPRCLLDPCRHRWWYDQRPPARRRTLPGIDRITRERAMVVEVSGYIRVATLADLQPTGRKVVSVAGRHIVLIRDGSAVRALDSRCPHMGYPLIKGSIKDGVL